MILLQDSNVLKTISKLFTFLPDYVKIIVVVLLVLFLATMVVRKMQVIFKTYNANARRSKKLTQAQLEYHYIFSQVDYWLKNRINSMNFGDTNRNKVFRVILKIHTEAIRDKSLELIKTPNLDSISTDQFQKIVLNNAAALVETYDQRIKEQFGSKLYELIMASEHGFNNWHSPVVQYNKSLCESICETTGIYQNNTEKTFAILNVYQAALDATYVNVEKMFYSFNGELTKYFRDNAFPTTNSTGENKYF